MTKSRFLVLGMALAALVFAGCDHTGANGVQLWTEADLAPWGNAVVRVDGVTVRLVKDFIIGGPAYAVYSAALPRAADSPDAYTIPAGCRLIVPRNMTLTVANNGNLKTSGTLELQARQSNAAAESGGKFVVENGGAVALGGTIEARESAVIEIKGGTVGISAEITAAPSAEIKLSGGTITLKADAVIKSSGEGGNAKPTITIDTEIKRETGAKIEEGVSVVIHEDSGGEIVNVTPEPTPTPTPTPAPTPTPTPAPETITLTADTVTDLNQHIASAKGEYASNPVIIQLSAAFYSAVNDGKTYIVIDPGNTDNTKAYTIRGLGKNADTALTTGIVLANNNVTLEEVKFTVTDPAKAAITKAAIDSYADTRYTAAVSIGRYGESAWLADDNLAGKNITVQNCNISYAKSVQQDYPFNAGIYVNGKLSAAAPQNIHITNNTVKSAGTNSNAAQAIVIGHYDPSIVITNNNLTSETGGAATINAPASALFLNINPNKIDASSSPQITGNTLDGKNIDFYVNIWSTGDYVGVPTLFASKFGTYYSTWVADAAAADNFYRKLYSTLIGQSKATGYAGLFFMVLGGTAGSYDGDCFVYEAWEKSEGTVNAVDYWGATILSSGEMQAYNAGAENKQYDTSAAASSDGTGVDGRTKAGYRGRIKLNGGKTYDNFHLSPSDKPDDNGGYLYAEGIPDDT
jgi:hypothetical protein